MLGRAFGFPVCAASSLSDAGLQRSSPQSPAGSMSTAGTADASQDATVPSAAAPAPAPASAWSKGGPSFASLFANVQPKTAQGTNMVLPRSVNFPSKPAAPPGLLDDKPYKTVSVEEDQLAKKLGGECVCQ